MNRRRIALHAGVVALATAITLALSQDARFLRAQLNADTLWQTSFIWDVLHRAGALQTFQVSTNTSLVPDFVLGLALQTVLGSWRWVVFVSALLRFIGYAYAGGWIARAIAGVSLPVAALYVEGIAGGLVLLGTAIPTSWNEGHLLYPALFPIATLLIADTHSGAFCVALGIVGVLLWSMRDAWRWWRAIVVYVLTALIVVSDREVWIEFVIPVLVVTIAAIAFGFVRRDVRGLAAAGGLGLLVFAGAWTGEALLPLFHHAPDLPTPTLAEFVAQWPRFWNDAIAFGRDHPNLIDGVLWLAMLALAFPAVLARRPGAAQQDERAMAFVLFSFVALGGAFAFCAALYQDDDSYRYIEPVLFLLVPIGLAVLVRARVARVAVRALVAGVFVASIVQIGNARSLVPGSVTWKPDLFDCVAAARAQYGVRAGIAGFWTSRPLTLAFDESVQIDQVQPDGSLQYYTNDVAWYRSSFADPGRPPDYRFVVMRELDERAIARRFGAPRHVLPCGDTALWIYDTPLRLTR